MSTAADPIPREPRSPETRWTDHAPWELVEHLLATHHPYTWSELARLASLARDVRSTDGARHPELADVEELVACLRADLEPHLTKEERVLFPYVFSLQLHETEGTTPPPPPFGSVRSPIRVLHTEHDAAIEILHRMREVTRSYAAPAGASVSHRALLDGLAALDRDVVRHIALESEVLFPMLLARDSKPV